MGWFECLLIFMLGLMLAHVIAIMWERMIRYRRARRESRNFLCDSKDAFCDGRLGDAVSIAARYRRSHIATVVASGLVAFASWPSHFEDIEAVEAAQRSLRRSQHKLTAQLRVGLSTLSAIAATAPFIGLLGTVVAILDSFRAIGGNKTTVMAAIAANLASSLAMTAAGLLVAVPAVWCRNYLRDLVENFETEISNAELETISYISAHSEWRTRDTKLAALTSIFEADRPSAPHAWEVRFDRSRLLLFAMWSGALVNGFLLAITLIGALLPEPQRHEDPPRWVSFGEQDVVSPDGRYRATVPGVVRERLDWPEEKVGRWSCWLGPRVALNITPNDRPRAWERQNCGPTTEHYELESGDAIMTRNCRIPVVMWRTNEELLVHCYGCSADEVQLVELKSFTRKLTVLGSDGKRLQPGTVHPQPRCY